MLAGFSCLGNEPLHFVSDIVPHKCGFQVLPPMLTNLGGGVPPLAPESPQNSFVPPGKCKKQECGDSSPSSEGLASCCSLHDESAHKSERTPCVTSVTLLPGQREEPSGHRPVCLLRAQGQGGNASLEVSLQFSCDSTISYIHSLPSLFLHSNSFIQQSLLTSNHSPGTMVGMRYGHQR